MRLTSLLFPTLFVAAAACAAPTTDGSEETEGTTASSISQACSMSRSKILSTVTGERKTAITRGFTWLDANVPYSQSKTHNGYRTDCSGFVSMCWQAGTPGLTTTTFSTSSKYDFYGDYEELLPGDGIDDPGHHVVLFLGWNDAAHKGACVIEQASTASDMQFRVRTTSSLKSGGFKPFRPKTFGTDNVVREGATDPEETTPTTPTAPTCVPKTAQAACQAVASVVECGEINDGCGGTVDCDTVAGFGCDSNSVCSFHMCQEKTPIVPPTTSTPDAGSSTPTTPSTPSTSPGSSTGSDSESGTDLQSQGEPGDEWGSNNRTPSTAAGCSAAPGTSNGLGFAGVALAIAGVLARRRRK